MVVGEIFRQNPAAKVIVFGASHHHQMLLKWMAFQNFSEFQFEFVNAETENNLLALLDESYSFDRYEQSLMQIQKFVDHHAPDLIVSDNLVGVLYPFPNAVLMGSFLFADILPIRTPDIDRICSFEFNLLQKLRPLMLGVEDMAMPSLRKKTNFQGLPWFCKSSDSNIDRPLNQKRNVLIAGGGTLNALEILQKICTKLTSDVTGFNMFVDQALLIEMPDNRNLQPFNFDAESFRSLDWIICRPGMGILTDAVQYCVPVVAVYEADREMEHNGKRIEELNMGYNFGNSQRDFFELNQDSKVLVENIRKRLTGGAAQAARFILNS